MINNNKVTRSEFELLRSQIADIGETVKSSHVLIKDAIVKLEKFEADTNAKLEKFFDEHNIKVDDVFEKLKDAESEGDEWKNPKKDDGE